MVDVFQDTERVSAHDDFQAWRVLHPERFFLNLNAKRKAMLHRAQCQHGDAFEDDSYSLTKRPKVCAAEIASLSEWASRSCVLEVTPCPSCDPLGRARQGD
jgi:hypothetical protein